MSVVLVDPGAGFAIDWDWRRRLTVWAVSGDRFGDRVAEHRLAARPAGQRQARRAAGRWWHEQGRGKALESAKVPATGAGPRPR